MSNGDSNTEREAVLRSCLSEAIAILDALNAPWVTIGALAAERYRASPRTTTDADLLVVWNPELPRRLEASGFELRVSYDDSEARLIRARRGTCSIDLIVAGTDYQRLAISRGIGGVLAVEDVLVHKLIAWRPKDRDDIRSILSTGRPLDDVYVDHWSHEWDVDDRWLEAKSWR
jgi:hypothetical protein